MSNIDQSMEEVLYELVELYLTNPPKDLHSFAFAGMCSLHVIQIFLDKGMTEDEKKKLSSVISYHAMLFDECKDQMNNDATTLSEFKIEQERYKYENS